ncbi:MAG: hypothetical protein R2752_03250 [Vicinamibacterales bacterium]
MATARQKQAARKNLVKARRAWKQMSSRARSRRQPEGRSRSRPGTKGSGRYYRVVVRDKSEFSSFRTQDVGRPNHVQRLAGHRKSGSWATQAWLISKKDAHRDGDRLVGDTAGVRKVLRSLRGPMRHVKGDIFEARPRRNVPEREKPTPAQQRARRRNIRKAQKARRTS